jgi:phosphoglycerate dehydrogenase-like enzyme
MKLLIVVHHRLDLWNVPGWFGERLAKEFPSLEIVIRNSYEGIEEHLREAEVIFTLSLRPAQFAQASKLRWLHAPSAAVHHLLFPESIKSDVVITNSREVHGPVVAEHVMALIFALAKKIPQAALMQEKGLWGQQAIAEKSPRLREVAGATLGLIGVGSIGSRVAQMASVLGMRVIAVREHPEKGRPEGVEVVFSPLDLDAVLGQSDYVVLAAPLLAKTERLMNAERFTKMKHDGYLINVGRGPQVDEVALEHALRQGRIGGGALDVFDQEPLPADSPLWAAPNLLITPHTAGLTDKLWYRHYDLFSDNLRRYLGGQSLRYVVDKLKGY